MTPAGDGAPVPGTEAVTERLAAIAEELADLALERLQVAVADGDADADARALAAEERRITRARRSVERAASILGGGPEGPAGGADG